MHNPSLAFAHQFKTSRAETKPVKKQLKTGKITEHDMHDQEGFVIMIVTGMLTAGQDKWQICLKNPKYQIFREWWAANCTALVCLL